MLIIYYALVAVLIKDNQRICESKLKTLSMGDNNMSKTAYGAETKKAISKLEKA